MWTKLKQLIVIAIAILLTSSMCFSQRKIAINNDTLICFSQDQSKTILKELARTNYLDSLNELNLSTIRYQEKIIENLNLTIKLQSGTIANNKELDEIKNAQLKQCEKDNSWLKKQIRKQKVFTALGCVLSGFLTGYTTYLVLN
jgi:hypothetical protein